MSNLVDEILNGKSIKEAYADWDRESQEQYSATDREQFEYAQEFADFRKKAKVKLDAFKEAVRGLNDVFDGCYSYDIPYFDAAGCPFKNLASLISDCDAWVDNISDMIDGGAN